MRLRVCTLLSSKAGAEASKAQRVVDMLSALTPCDRDYDSKASNVVEWGGKSRAIVAADCCQHWPTPKRALQITSGPSSSTENAPGMIEPLWKAWDKRGEEEDEDTQVQKCIQ